MFYVDPYNYERLRLVGGLVICKDGFRALGIVGASLVIGVEFIFWGWCLCRWDRVWVVFCVVLCVSLCSDFVGFFILFGLWCRLRCS